jgi:RimJ/RimL family protein N-acetyltransferase
VLSIATREFQAVQADCIGQPPANIGPSSSAPRSSTIWLMRVGKTADRQSLRGVVDIEYGKRSFVIPLYCMVTVRLLDPHDAEQFKALRLLAIDNSPTAIWPTRQEELTRSIDEIVARIRPTLTQAVFGAFESEMLIGITGVRREPLCQVNHKATIWGVFVNPSYRGRGIAQTLLSAATTHAAEEWDAIQLMLCVNAENLPAKTLHASHGFQTFGLEPRAMKVGDRYYDEEHMCKQLA